MCCEKDKLSVCAVEKTTPFSGCSAKDKLSVYLHHVVHRTGKSVDQVCIASPHIEHDFTLMELKVLLHVTLKVCVLHCTH